MWHAVNGILLLAALAATVALYAISYDTRRLEAKVQAEERALERAQTDVTILRAERAHLARPERLEPLARELGLAPIGSGQYLRLERAAASGPTSGPKSGSTSEPSVEPRPATHASDASPPAKPER